VSGEQTGPTEGFHADGSPAFRGALRAGAQDGVWEEWQRDGRLRYRGEFAAGVRLRESFWHANGELELAGDYRDGLRHGTWTQRSDTGEVRATCRWRRGELAAPCNEHDGAQLSAPAARAEP
jgi:antitoxin component YwqK of YwqJK toxin-antitoxin module